VSVSFLVGRIGGLEGGVFSFGPGDPGLSPSFSSHFALSPSLYSDRQVEQRTHKVPNL